MKSLILEFIEPKIDDNIDKIVDFFRDNFKKFPQNIYNSVDLRHSGFKIAPVDTNCFPAGFNNISGDNLQKAKLQAKLYLEKFLDLSEIKNIAIIGENHTRNLNYLANLQSLHDIFSLPDKNTFICSLAQDRQDSYELDYIDGKKILVNRISRVNDELFVNQDTKIDLVILNNDLTNHAPEIFDGLVTKVIPSVNLGWFQRSKFTHFEIYNNLCEEVSKIIGIDPWLISSYHELTTSVNFKDKIGFEELAVKTEEVLTKIRTKYEEYSIKEDPFCYIKSDSGTYGMAVTQVYNSQDIQDFNKKIRNKMNMIKDNRQTTSVQIQEGIPTIDLVKGAAAEPLIYIMNGKIIANLARSNESRSNVTSLNSTGAMFHDLEQENNINIGGEFSNMKKVYWLVATLASLATSIEAKNLST